jgi:hypothetical protein
MRFATPFAIIIPKFVLTFLIFSNLLADIEEFMMEFDIQILFWIKFSILNINLMNHLI